jgi:molybdate transport system regulatory protein
MNAGDAKLGARLRVVLAQDVALGTGKADILERIRDTGSISEAGREMGMSYKRAWKLIDGLNRTFREPLVETTRGGSSHGGAVLTASGEEVLARFRRMEAATEAAVEDDLAALRRLVARTPG